MTQEEHLFQEAREAVKRNELEQARSLLARLLKINRSNLDYWLWMSAVVETRKERVFCLKEVLRLDPGNLLAIRGLRLADENIADPAPPPGILEQMQEWKTSLELEAAKPAAPKGVRRKVFAWSALGILVVGLVATGLILGLRPRYRPDTSPIMKFSLTPPPTATTGITPSATFEGPAPLWTLLDATFTPTPLYVATPHNRTEAYQVAIHAYVDGDWSKALEYFKQVLTDEPNSPDIQYYIGETNRFLGQNKNALAAYDAAIKLDPNFAPAYLGKARLEMKMASPDLDDAEELLRKALDLDPQLYEAILTLAQISLAKNDPVGALTWTGPLGEALPQTALVESIRAQAYLLQGENDLALSSIIKANKLDVTSLPIYKLWGEILQTAGRYKESVKPLTTYLTYAESDPEAEVMLARAQVESGDLDAALDTLNSILVSGNTIPEALVLRGEIYLEQEKFDLAEADLNNALRLNSQSSAANIGKGRIMLLQDYPGLAYEYMKTAVEIAVGDREMAKALYWRAVALIDLGEMSAAIRDLETVLAFPEGILSNNLREQALETYLPLVTPTPSLTPSATKTPFLSFTPEKTYTPTRTPTPTRTTTIVRTPTRTPVK